MAVLDFDNLRAVDGGRLGGLGGLDREEDASQEVEYSEKDDEDQTDEEESQGASWESFDAAVLENCEELNAGGALHVRAALGAVGRAVCQSLG